MAEQGGKVRRISQIRLEWLKTMETGLDETLNLTSPTLMT